MENIFIKQETPSSISRAGLIHFQTTVNKLENLFGLPIIWSDEDFNDDSDKVSMVWDLKNKNNDNLIHIYDFKGWHYQKREVEKDEDFSFSLEYENKEEAEYLIRMLGEPNITLDTN